MDRGSWDTYTAFIWIELRAEWRETKSWRKKDSWKERKRASERASERRRKSSSRVINLVGCRQTKFSVCWFIMNTLRKWNSNGVRIFQLDSKFYCRQFFIRAWNAPTHEQWAHHIQTHKHTHIRSAQWNMFCGENCLHTMPMKPGVQSAGLLVCSVLKNSNDAIRMLLLLLLLWPACTPFTMAAECRWWNRKKNVQK